MLKQKRRVLNDSGAVVAPVIVSNEAKLSLDTKGNNDKVSVEQKHKETTPDSNDKIICSDYLRRWDGTFAMHCTVLNRFVHCFGQIGKCEKDHKIIIKPEQTNNPAQDHKIIPKLFKRQIDDICT